MMGDNMQKIREIYDIAALTPVWPFNYKVIFSFMGSILAPFLFMIVDKILGELVIK